jgi:hypothetical protein
MFIYIANVAECTWQVPITIHSRCQSQYMAGANHNTWQVLITLIVDLPNMNLPNIHLLYISISLPQSKRQESGCKDWIGNLQIAELAGV